MIRLMGSSALALVLALGLGSGQALAQAAACDRDGNGHVSADEADDCADQEYTTLLGGKESMSEDDFVAVHDEEAWSKVDADEDGTVTRAEFVDWRRSEFDAALGASEEMPNADFEALGGAAGVQKSQGADSQTSGGGSDDSGTSSN